MDITVTELKRRLDAGENLLIIDVREPGETAIGHLPQAKLIPMGTLPGKMADLDLNYDQEIILICRSGGRSGAMTSFLQSNGFRNARNMMGGMLAWAAQIDPTMRV